MQPETTLRAPLPAALLRRRLALFVLYLMPGVGIASWVTRTPDVRDLLGASTAQMGMVLFGLSIGSMIGILGSGPLVTRFGTRPIIAIGVVLDALGVLLIGLGAHLAHDLLVAIGLGLFGLGMGAAEVGMNVEGAEVERLFGRSVMPTLHGFFSLGTLIGAIAGMALTAWRVPVLSHLAVVAVIIVVALALVIGWVPAGGAQQDSTAQTHTAGPPVWRDRRLLGLGAVILALALAEGTANDWLPLVMVDGHGFKAAWGSGIFAAFALAMTIGRFVGGWFVDRFGRAAVLAGSAVLGAAGLALVIFVDNPVVAALAVLLWGMGASLGFPVALSAAGDSGPNPAARVAIAATIGYLAFLVGPPALGQLGEHFGLRRALIAVLVLVALAIVFTPAARPVSQQVEVAEPDSTDLASCPS